MKAIKNLNIEALKELLKVVQATPISNLDMGVWAKKKECGTIACIAGNAAMTPYFNKIGLHLEELIDYDEPKLVPKYEEHSSYDALSAAFGINNSATYWLFDPGYYLYTSGELCKQEAISKIKLLLQSEGVVVE